MLNEKNDKIQQGLLPVINKLILVIVVLVVGLIAMLVVFYVSNQPDNPKGSINTSGTAGTLVKKESVDYWIAPDVSGITDTKQKEQIAYGKELIAHTAK